MDFIDNKLAYYMNITSPMQVLKDCYLQMHYAKPSPFMIGQHM